MLTWLCALSAKLLQRAHSEGIAFYVHCSGGHFRTGTLCSVLIGLAYGVSGTHALGLFQALHDLAGNAFARAPALHGLRHLQVLDLSRNRLTSLSLDGLADTLRELDLSHNKLRTLPSGIGELRQLRIP